MEKYVLVISGYIKNGIGGGIMEKKLPEKIDIDKSLHILCQNSIDLIEYARGITAKQINIIQLMTFYSIGKWIVEE